MFALAACGGGGDEKSTTEPSEQGQAQTILLKYAQCMRDNGVDVADPIAGDPGSMYQGVDRDSAAFTKANDVCAPILQGVVQDRQNQNTDTAAQHEEMLALAQCLRDHGVNVKDPIPGADKPFGDSLDRTDPAVAAAIKACAAARPSAPGQGPR